jgi:hypothetical protein
MTGVEVQNEHADVACAARRHRVAVEMTDDRDVVRGVQSVIRVAMITPMMTTAMTGFGIRAMLPA